jgi:hypothetical protein
MASFEFKSRQDLPFLHENDLFVWSFGMDDGFLAVLLEMEQRERISDEIITSVSLI